MNKKLLPLIVALKKLKSRKIDHKELFLELDLPKIVREDFDHPIIIKNKQERGVAYLDLFGDEKI